MPSLFCLESAYHVSILIKWLQWIVNFAAMKSYQFSYLISRFSMLRDRYATIDFTIAWPLRDICNINIVTIWNASWLYVTFALTISIPSSIRILYVTFASINIVGIHIFKQNITISSLNLNFLLSIYVSKLITHSYKRHNIPLSTSHH